jgi:pyruvate/2-oxoglutarate dehydrogenase complex dihydrolipoamide acyltransferase (E2) component
VGDPLCKIETDKATLDLEAQEDGILAKILVQGDTAKDLSVGTPVCILVEDEKDVPAFANYGTSNSYSNSGSSSSSEKVDGGLEPSLSSTTHTAVATFLPSARHLAESKGVDATGLIGSGKGGRITKGDVLKALALGSLPPKELMEQKAKGGAATTTLTTMSSVTSPPSSISSAVISPPTTAATTSTTTTTSIVIPQASCTSFQDVPNNNMRKIIAKRLTESKRDVPHFYTSVEVELDNVLALRKQLATQQEVKVSVNDFVLKACALALRDVPEVNASYSPTTQVVRPNPTIDVSVAVATPTGLITPIVPNVDQIGLFDITEKVRDLATRARLGKLTPNEYQGGTFTVSNLGMFGIDEFSAVINPPQAAILAVGGGSQRVIASTYDDSRSLNDQPKPQIRTVMTAKLSADRRVVDEATAAMFMQAFQLYLSNPLMLLL